MGVEGLLVELTGDAIGEFQTSIISLLCQCKLNMLGNSSNVVLLICEAVSTVADVRRVPGSYPKIVLTIAGRFQLSTRIPTSDRRSA